MGSARVTPRFTYKGSLVAADAARKGWNQAMLAHESGLSAMTISRFLSDQMQTPKSAARIARALGYDVQRYLRA